MANVGEKTEELNEDILELYEVWYEHHFDVLDLLVFCWVLPKQFESADTERNKMIYVKDKNILSVHNVEIS